MNKSNLNKVLFCIASIFAFIGCASAAEYNVDISYGTVLHFIPGSQYEGVTCSYSGDKQYFEFSDTTYSEDHYVEMINPSITSGSATAVCSYTKKKSHIGSNMPVVSTDGSDTFKFNIVKPKDLSKFKLVLHRQFSYMVNLKTYFTLNEAANIDKVVLTGDLVKIFEHSNGEVACNTQSCVLKLAQNAPTGTFVGTVKYGQVAHELTVEVKDEWIVYANTGGYGSCEFDEGWELNGNNVNYYEKSINTNGTRLPICNAGPSQNNAYLGLKFVGWAYNKQVSNHDYNNYQSIDVCATYADNTDPNVGFIKGGELFAPANLDYDYRGNSVFYACYKTDGIGFNLVGYSIEDDTDGIQSWDLAKRDGEVISRIRFKVFDDSVQEMVLPKKVKNDGIVDNNEVFVGWINNVEGKSKVYSGGEKVNVHKGLIFTPYFMIQKTETERNITVYTKKKIVVELPSDFVCINKTTNNYSIVGTGNKCTITGIASTNGDYISEPIVTNSKTYTLKIQVVEGAYNVGDEIPDITIGDGELIVDPGDGSGGNIATKIPADCDSYLVGRYSNGVSVVSSDLFKYSNIYAQVNPGSVTYKGHIITYYARSNCAGANNEQHETEYAALCLDPGRAAPPRTNSYKTVNNSGFQGVQYEFFDYIDVNHKSEGYRQFSRAVAFIVNQLGNVPLATFNDANYVPKLAANIALRIIATQYDGVTIPPAEGVTGNEGDNIGTISYYNAFNAYQTMGIHLNGRIGYADKRVYAFGDEESCKRNNADGSVNHDRSMYMSCNEEWSWEPGTEELQETIANYLSYAYLGDFSNSNWEVTPELKVTSRQSNRMELVLTYPRSINFRYDKDGNQVQFGNYDVTLNISNEMSKIYQINEGALMYGTNEHLKCEQYYENNCVRYKVYMLPDLTPSDNNFARHPIYLDFSVSDSANISFPDPNSRDIYLEVGYSSSYTKESAFIVQPADGSTSIQRMILFNPEKVTKVFPLNMYDCDVLLQGHGNNPAKYEQIYKAGCCETISDDSTEYQDFVNTYCKKNCVMNNYKPVCTSQDDVTDYKIHEAMTKEGNVNYACIVDARKPDDLSVENQLLIMSGDYEGDRDYYLETSNMTDILGQNSIAISDYKTNPYCRVTCKEDWEFNMPGYGDFIGANAVKAGSVFQINHSINLKSTVTCVTSYIDIEGYEAALRQLSGEINDAYEKYSLRAAAYTDLYATYVDKGAWYTYKTKILPCGADEFDSDGNNPAASSCGWITSYNVDCDKNHIGQGSCKINGNYEIDPSATCTKTNSSSNACSVSGSYTRNCVFADGTSGEGNNCTHNPKNGCPAGLGYEACTDVGGTITVPCTNGDSNHNGCTVTKATAQCTNSSHVGKTGCYLTGEYTIPCSYSEVKAGTNSNCHFTGSYLEVTQDKHSGDGSTSDSNCLIWQVRTSDTTKINSYKIDGTEDIDRSHSSINGKKDDGTSLTGYAETEYEEGTSNACNNDKDVTCKLHKDAVVKSYKCEVTASGDKSESTWKQHLIDDHVYYASDTKLIKTNIEYYYKLLGKKQITLTNVVDKFAQCQNFYVNNANASGPSKVFNGSSYSSVLDVLEVSYSSYSINTKFDPAGTFGYDEADYMGMMGDKRIIASQNGYSTSSKSGMYSYEDLNVGSFNSCYGIEGNYVDASGNSVGCSTVLNGVSYFETDGYDFNNNLLSNYTFVLCDLGGSLNYTYDGNDKCASSNYYYYNANYVKKSLTSSGDYDNKVTWYRYLVNDSIYPGFDFANVNSKKSAAGNVSTPYDPEDWSVMGTKNVFPISGTTRRNIYQYYYSFKGIGNYYNGVHSDDRNSIGRLMGYEDSIIKSNSRICFYEVYESACICCGKNELGPVTEMSKVNSYQYVGYKESSFKDGSGHYGFTPSTVSLYNLDGFANNSHAANWQANDHYFYNGNNSYTTNKGKELADYIEEKGENAYAETPEYSYILTPNAMANIRKMNSSATYGYGKDTVYQIDNSTYLAYSSSENGHLVTTDVADKIIFTHYGSNFVKEKLAVYETPEYKDQLLSNMEMASECYVTSNNISSLNDKKKKCKWVDYVQTVVPGNSSQGYFRMAFK